MKKASYSWKRPAKKLLSKDEDNYTFAELINVTLGRMEFVARQKH